MNIYLKTYGIWLGGSLGIVFILSWMNLLPYGFGILFDYLVLIGGTITGTVMTHKALGKNIQFGKAIGPVLLIIGAIRILGVVATIISWGGDALYFVLPYQVINILADCFIATMVLVAAGTWYMFEKAGKTGWACLIPIYNLIVMLDIAKKPTWWVAMFFIPIANIVFMIMMLDGISKNFGKDSGFTVGLVFLGQIFFAVLGYGPAVYLNAEAHRVTDDRLIDNIEELN